MSVVGMQDSYRETGERVKEGKRWGKGEERRRRRKRQRILGSGFLPLQAFDAAGRAYEVGPVGRARFLPGSIMDMFPPAQSWKKEESIWLRVALE